MMSLMNPRPRAISVSPRRYSGEESCNDEEGGRGEPRMVGLSADTATTEKTTAGLRMTVLLKAAKE